MTTESAPGTGTTVRGTDLSANDTRERYREKIARIGLALVKGLTEMHGGTVIAKSDGEGQGSTFVVTLPILPDHAQVADEHAPSAQMARPSRRVLVVDDNRDGAESLGMMLELAGHEVALAHDGFESD